MSLKKSGFFSFLENVNESDSSLPNTDTKFRFSKNRLEISSNIWKTYQEFPAVENGFDSPIFLKKVLLIMK